MPFQLHIPLRRCAAALLPALAVAVAVGPGVASAGAPIAAPDQVIVRFKSSSTPAARERARDGARTSFRGKLRLSHAQLLQVRGGSVSSAVRTLERRSDVEYAEPNHRVHAVAAYPTDPKASSLWGLHSVRGPEVWDTASRGSGQVVAVVDTGVAMTHPDLRDDLWTKPGSSNVHGYDFVGDDSDPTDENEHGTHVAGTIAAEADNGIGVAGVAPAAKIMPVRVLDADGSGYDSDVASGVTYAADQGARTINLSLGGAGSSQTMSLAISHAAAAGAVVVAAAGNDRANNDGANPEYPCAYPQTNLVCVAAIASDGSLASFSNYGATSVDVAAPGVSVLSTVPTFAASSGYATFSGTSMATPHVSGVVALVHAALPNATPAEVAQAIRTGAIGQSNLSGKTVSGGHADAPGAIGAAGGLIAERPATTTKSPGVTTRPSSKPTTSSSPVRATSKPAVGRACSGLRGRRLARCKLSRRIERVCGKRHGRSHRVCVRRVKALARCEAKPSRTRSQRHRRAGCVRRARAIGRTKHR
jgi:subtilisin family serine protease